MCIQVAIAVSGLACFCLFFLECCCVHAYCTNVTQTQGFTVDIESHRGCLSNGVVISSDNNKPYSQLYFGGCPVEVYSPTSNVE